ncbi:hypothetical protein CDAR_69241 [Caerostris darwini]|uniref:Uncharacterized protein n=1 Tax=Caerostris darwini TaxID=1538125 RepID=A0AAV4U0J4_9ARAC|nr:hypothetical protein CDAR_69241 [Caerostris darwini]
MCMNTTDAWLSMRTIWKEWGSVRSGSNESPAIYRLLCQDATRDRGCLSEQNGTSGTVFERRPNENPAIYRLLCQDASRVVT